MLVKMRLFGSTFQAPEDIRRLGRKSEEASDT